MRRGSDEETMKHLSIFCYVFTHGGGAVPDGTAGVWNRQAGRAGEL